MNEGDIQILKENDNRTVKITTWDGEVLTAKVLFVSELDQDLAYDLVSTSRESQYEKNDEQPAYRISFDEIKSVEALSNPS